jgi:alkylation response protein AidB-like acyl-CoA dehydrogenase
VYWDTFPLTLLTEYCSSDALFVSGWLADVGTDRVQDSWWAQRERYLKRLGADGTSWGVLLSERGGNTRSIARPTADGSWSLFGEKLSGSGWDHVSFMLASAIPEGEAAPDVFVLDLRDRASRTGAAISQPWDAHGMTSSGSHGIGLNGITAERVEWPGRVEFLRAAPTSPITAARLAPFAGIVRAAVTTAAQSMAARGGIAAAWNPSSGHAPRPTAG